MLKTSLISCMKESAPTAFKQQILQAVMDMQSLVQETLQIMKVPVMIGLFKVLSEVLWGYKQHCRKRQLKVAGNNTAVLKTACKWRLSTKNLGHLEKALRRAIKDTDQNKIK